ncbi:MAG: zinc ABC transporter substrate-binding protein [Eubacteriales bacterium SKADARSKE-1]|nr:zinc ABC transporter substrate-binding protein [Eubacteriales bacterium SKADARSKE-1]
MQKTNLIRVIKFISAMLIIASMLTGCSPMWNPSDNKDNSKIKVVASLFPQYDFAKQIAKDKAEVTLLLPPGTESHTFDPGPGDIIKISDSDMFLYTGKHMEPWADRLISGIDNKNLKVVDVSAQIGLLNSNHEHDEAEEANGEEHDHEYDPHIWLDPILACQMVDNIASAFCEKDPANANFYNENATAYKKELQLLDSDISNAVKASKRKTMVFASRFSYLYFINRYKLDYIAAFDGCSAESEPSVKKMTEIIDFIKTNNIPVIYYEEFDLTKIAKSICDSTGVKALKFSTVHNVSKGELESGKTYLEIMRENLENLKQGLI